jgi:signal transduction histidine kinase
LLYIIPSGVVLITLIVLVLLPMITNRRVNALRNQIEESAEPARADLNQLNYQLGVQITSLNRAGLTGEEGHLQTYHRAGVARGTALDSLKRDVARLGPEAVRQYEELSAEIQNWDLSVERYLRTRSTDDGAAEALIEREASYTGILREVSELDAAISGFQAGRRQRTREMMRRQVQISAVVVILALIAAASVLWLNRRLLRLAESLEHESSQRKAALEREQEARSVAESLVKARDEILGVVSHDLRSPLTTITLSAQLLQGSTPEEQGEHITMIQSTTRRMERLIQDLLDAAKLEAGPLKILKVPFDPAGTAREAFRAHEPMAKEKQIHLTAAIQDPLPELYGDADRILQALSNLLGNALKFTPSGGIIELRTEEQDGQVRFLVRDTGPGIAPSDLPHLFEPFWQAKKTAHLGAGLGLKITRAIADAHGGSIDVENCAEGGACFTLIIPAASAIHAQMAASRPRESTINSTNASRRSGGLR